MSTKTLFPLLVTGIVTAGLFILSFINLNHYYANYGIDIKQWMAFDEWFAMNFDAFLDHLFRFFVIGLFSWFILAFREMQVKRMRQSMSRKTRIFTLIVSTIFYLGTSGAMIYFTAFDSLAASTDPYLDTIVTIVVLSLLAVSILMQNLFDTIKKEHVLTLICVVGLFLNAMAFSDKKIKISENSVVVSKVTFNGMTIDSVRYLGSSRQYYFFKKIKGDHTFILERSKVLDIQMIHKKGMMLSIH